MAKTMPLLRRMQDKAGRHAESGQMTVEFVVAFPVMLAVAVIAVNALLFFSECAAFDRVARDAVRVYATSPAYGQGTEQSLALIQQAVDARLTKEYLSSSVGVEGDALGHATYTATLEFGPNLFGMGMRSSVFGVELPRLSHTTSLTVDVYKPGALL